MVLLASDFDQSKYLKASDLGPLNSERRVKIKGVTVEKIGEKEEIKPCLQFTNTSKGLPLNQTNRRTLSAAFGDVMDAWAGNVIALYSTMVDLKGQMVPALRVRILPPKQTTAAPQQPAASPQPIAPSQPVPLGNGAAHPAVAPAAVAAELEPEPIDELDDEIPF